MKKENIFAALGIIGIIGFFVLIIYSMKMPPEQEVMISPTPPPVNTIPQDGNMNPNYGELTPEQISVADIAIGKLLNSSEGVSPPMVSVLSFEAQDFPDSSLGCPQGDQMYSQVVTPGYKVILEAQGTEYDYRLTDEKNVMLCE